jgi:hypothetical protein
MSHSTHFVSTAGLPQKADQPRPPVGTSESGRFCCKSLRGAARPGKFGNNRIRIVGSVNQMIRGRENCSSFQHQKSFCNKIGHKRSFRELAIDAIRLCLNLPGAPPCASHQCDSRRPWRPCRPQDISKLSIVKLGLIRSTSAASFLASSSCPDGVIFGLRRGIWR